MSEIEREAMEVDVVIVGAGPAGLSAAIRLKQIDEGLNVVVLEKGSEVGAHILSGAVLDPSGLDRLIPDWKDKGAPVRTAVSHDEFLMLSENGGFSIPTWPMPPLMSNHGAYIVSMGNVARWLAEQAEALGVEIYPGMSCSELICDPESGVVKGVVAGEFGKNPDGTPGPAYEPGMELLGKYVFLAEGVRGSLAKQVMSKFELCKGRDFPKYGIGMKEIWEIDPAKHKEGTVTHTMGWPLGKNASGGGFAYHAENNQLFLGLVVHLNYENPHLHPYMEFQRMKHHPKIAALLEGGKRVAYGARAIAAGGYQSMPKAVFPGGALLGDNVGLVNYARIKGNHNAMLSGIAAAEAAAEAIKAGRSGDVLDAYEAELRSGDVARDLKPVRNVKPLMTRLGLRLGLMVSGFDMWFQTIFKSSLFGTMKHGKSDAAATGRAKDFLKIDYPKPDGTISFDRLTNLSFSATNHEESQPCHLHLKDPDLPIALNLPEYDEPAQRYCPAGVYEVVQTEAGPKFQINFQNCVHCKTCDIKDPQQNITWKVPQGGDGPNYPNM
ncbi:electron transfer flavoprotein-ubiquinone oxidoreductase [Maritimibacter sp. HL-12]|uniref:electron transfer flavoprotein-ubiquinone oxidoreductase n=1 Tax=Maritimibacter sp. HL-12 TaxID=1162418 RepID=UPI000A0F0608|nr:electron transfer flavoprotein-ubiquinone oxidoreductase [Maritimibacter sp. HL-12]SMH40909.1 electron-transferring-flavoprotein dehydrogenase [Maritimibacter sp. HL-12]